MTSIAFMKLDARICNPRDMEILWCAGEIAMRFDALMSRHQSVSEYQNPHLGHSASYLIIYNKFVIEVGMERQHATKIGRWSTQIGDTARCVFRPMSIAMRRRMEQ